MSSAFSSQCSGSAVGPESMCVDEQDNELGRGGGS